MDSTPEGTALPRTSPVEDQRAGKTIDVLIDSTMGLPGPDFFSQMTAGLCEWLRADCVIVAEFGDNGQAATLSMRRDGEEIAGHSYPLNGGPCGQVATQGFCSYPEGVKRLFPDSEALAEMNAEGYVGTPLRNTDGKTVGVMCAISRKKLELPVRGREVLEVIASRAAVEIERRGVLADLEDSEHRFREVIQSTPLGTHIYTLEPDGRLVFTDANPAADRILGVECRRFIGKTIEKAFPPLADTEVPDAYRRVAVSGESWQTEQVDYEHGVIRGAYEVHAFQTSPGRVAVMFQDISERKRAQEALHDSEERLKILFENAPDGCYLIDLKGVFVDGNRAAEEMVGYQRGELVGKSFFKTRLLPVSQIPKVTALLALNVLGRPTGPDELVLRRKDGSRVNIEIRTYPVKIKDRTLVLGIARDISTRKRAEEALRSSEERFRGLFEQSNDAIFMHTLGGRILDVNRSAAKLLGYSRRELLEASIVDLHSEDSRQGVGRALRTTLEHGSVRFETRFRRKDHSLVDVDISARLVDRENGIIQGVARDITERKRLQEEQRKYATRLEADVIARTAEIRQSQARYRALFEDVEHAIITTDPDGRITACNPAATRLMGRQQGEVVGNLICTAMCGNHTCPRFAEVLATLRGKGTLTHECTIVRGDLHQPIHCAISVIHGHEESTQGHIWVITDVSEQARLREEVRLAHEYAGSLLRRSGPYGQLIGSGKAWELVARFVSDAAAVPSPVLILGESGTGKEVAARAIHVNSPRAEQPFVILDCAALKGDLLESELFGHEKGAFTGATDARPGLVEVAGGGTLFVDEIGEMPLELQSKLLRVLEHGEFRRVGATTTQKADIRVIAATNRDLACEVKEERFRGDLYYRVNVLSITMPPLRERREDVPLLAQHFVDTSRVTINVSKHLHRDALRHLQAYDWPGNVRELANVIERAIILSGDDPVITHVHLPPEVRAAIRAPAKHVRLRTLEQAERDVIVAALAATNGNRTHTARALKTSLVTLRRKLKKYDIG
jgi:sigma-54 dependent transcriptional regulator, acetoin dehydrogenase operon transcriptional activator AcoR